MIEKKRKSKAGIPRTEVFAMRLDPKTKYLCELAARKERRSLANWIEWAMARGLTDTLLDHGMTDEGEHYSTSVADKNTLLWDVDEADRLAKLAFEEPTLMSYEEEILWKLISATGYVWHGNYTSEGEWQWNTNSKKINLGRLRECWDDLKKVANGEAEPDILPTVPRNT